MSKHRILLGIKLGILVIIVDSIFIACASISKKNEHPYTVLMKFGISDNHISKDWIDALKTRERVEYLDSLASIEQSITTEEKSWSQLIQSKLDTWSNMRDSMAVPFHDVTLPDTVYVLLGYLGHDDGFTFGNQTVCFDLTSLYKAYGSADQPENADRIDRIFAHELTHLFSKAWASKKDLSLNSFKDSILWECMYEGMGMYRSMSAKWFPHGDSLSDHSAQVFTQLYSVFTQRLITVDTMKYLSTDTRRHVNKNLSRGSMNQKWGALPVAVWLAMEAKGDDKNLIRWIDMGPDAIIPLARKHLTGKSKAQFEEHFGLK